MENVGLMVALAGAMTKAPTAEQVSTAVDAWLDDHPEATTTVTDGAITNAKLASSFVTPGTAAAYSSSATYAVGDYVFYGGALYRCVSAIATAEAWTAAHWTAVNLSDDVVRIMSVEKTDTDNEALLLNWKIGDMSNGVYKALNYRVCSDKVVFSHEMTFVAKSGYQVYTVTYNDDGTNKQTISFRTSIRIPPNLPFSITIRRNPESTSTPAVLSTFIANVVNWKSNVPGSLPIYTTTSYAQASNLGARARTEKIPGSVGRISVKAVGFKHYMEPFNSNGTQLADTSWVTGSADYELDESMSYVVVFGKTDNSTIDLDDLKANTGVFPVYNGMPDVVNDNRDRIPLIQQLFVGRPTFVGETDHVLPFVWFSDIHKEQLMWDRVMRFARYYNSKFKFVIHSGDYVGKDQASYNQLYENGVSAGIPMLNVVGNHDIYSDFDNRTEATKANTKGIIMPSTTDWDVTWGTTDNPMNYYKDFTTEGVRVIVLDDYYDTDAQATWLATVLADAKSNGLHVLTVAHETSKPITTFADNTFCSKDAALLTSEGSLNHSSTPYDAVIASFISGGGVHIAHLCGHEHVDLMGTSAAGVMNIVIGSQHGMYTDASDSARVEHTRSNDLFNCVKINTNIGQMSIVRVGATSDHYLRGRNVLTYDYINKTVVSNW